MHEQLLLFSRFGIATVSCAVAYLGLWFMLIRLFGAGMYLETEVPVGKPDLAHRRARRLFLLSAGFVEVAVVLIGYGLYVLYPAAWRNFDLPIMVGASFSMLYALGTRFDRIRPPQRYASVRG